MRIRVTAAMAAVLLCTASLGSASDLPPGQSHLYGAGGLSCGKWLAERSDPNQILANTIVSWVLGWVSASGYYNMQGPLRETDAPAISAWVDKYCRENPLNNVQHAAASLVDELSKPQ